MDDLDAWLDDYKPYISSAKVCGRADLIVEHARADAELVAAQATSGDTLASREVSEAKRRVEELQAQIEASEREFTFQGIGHKPYHDLKRKFPPTDQQRRDGLDTDLERFAPALIAASSLGPRISDEQAQRLFIKLPPGEFEKLFHAALESNGEIAGPPKSVLAALIDSHLTNGASSTTALPEASPDPSSSDADDVLSIVSSETKKARSSGSRSNTTRSSSPKTPGPRSNGKANKT